MKKSISALKIFPLIFLVSACVSSKDLEKDVNESDFLDSGENIEEEELKNESELKGFFIQEEQKVQDVEDTIVYIDRPVYVPEQKDVPELERKNLSGYEAAVESQKRATKSPERYKEGTFFYTYSEDLVYEIYAQPYHLTDIILEAGEVVNATPLLSEGEEVWELTAGVAKDPLSQQDIQHIFIKPAYSKLDSSLVIITNRRVYHFRIKSFADTHMAMVKFTYPTKRNQWAGRSSGSNSAVETDFVRITNPELLSFDYKMSYSMWRKPEFLPTRVYDDGQSTYIQVNDSVLQKKLPVLFNEKNEIINYSVKRNIFVIPRLINKVTLRLGKEKVTIQKKKTKAVVVEQKEESANGRTDTKSTADGK